VEEIVGRAGEESKRLGIGNLAALVALGEATIGLRDSLAAAARTIGESPGAMQLRTLQTIDSLGPTASNTVVLAVPVEMMEAIKDRDNAPRNGYQSHAGSPA